MLCLSCGNFIICRFICGEWDLLAISGFRLSGFLQFFLIGHVIFFTIQQEFETGNRE